VKRSSGRLGLPSIAIITPSFNQSAYLSDTLCSVLEQAYPSLYYGVVDGGSSDGSTRILESYKDRLQGLIIEPDNGQYDALNKGFREALASSDAEVMGWINSDDLLLPKALHAVGEIFANFPQVEWISCLVRAGCSHQGHINTISSLPGLAREAFSHNRYIPAADPFSAYGFIQQESTFWRRSIWERAGGYVSTRHGLAGDYELWHRFYQYGDCVGLTIPLALNRVQHRQQSVAIGRYNADASPLIYPIPPSQSPRVSLLRRLRRHGMAQLPAVQKKLARRIGYRGQRIVLDAPQGPESRWRLEDYAFL
jgi:glycosyltransferase involved in cell wall biosynthesis